MSRGLMVWFHTIRTLGKAHRVFIAARSRTRAAQVYTFGGHLSVEGLKEAHCTPAGEDWAPSWIQSEGVWVERAAWPGEGWEAGSGYQQPVREDAFEQAKDMQDAVCILGDLHAAVMGRPPAPQTVAVPLSAIEAEASAQARAILDEDALEEYTEAMRSGVIFPPVVLFFDGTTHWLADGFHRVAAAYAAGITSLQAEVRPGGLREAQLFAIGANVAHGIRRTNADKRRAVELLLADAEWSKWSNREIGRRAGVSDMTVGRIRNEMSQGRVQQCCTPDGKGEPAALAKIATPEPPEESLPEPDEVEQIFDQIGRDLTALAGGEPITTASQVRELGREAIAQAQAESEEGPEPEADEDPEPPGGGLEAAPGEVEALRQQVADLQAQVDELHQLIRDGQADAEAVARILEADDRTAQALAEVKRAHALAAATEQQLRQIQGRAAFLGSEAEKWKRIAEKTENAQPRKEKRQATPKTSTPAQAESDAIPTEPAWD